MQVKNRIARQRLMKASRGSLTGTRKAWWCDSPCSPRSCPGERCARLQMFLEHGKARQRMLKQKARQRLQRQRRQGRGRWGDGALGRWGSGALGRWKARQRLLKPKALGQRLQGAAAGAPQVDHLMRQGACVSSMSNSGCCSMNCLKDPMGSKLAS